VVGGPSSADGGSGWWPVVLASCASHSEPSRLDVALEVSAQVHYQVGFASLELDLEVCGEMGLPGMLVAAWARWRVLGDRLAGFGCQCAMTTGRAGAVRRCNRALLPTVGWSSVAGCGGGGPHRDAPVDLDLLGLDLVKVARAMLVAEPAARSRTPAR